MSCSMMVVGETAFGELFDLDRSQSIQNFCKCHRTTCFPLHSFHRLLLSLRPSHRCSHTTRRTSTDCTRTPLHSHTTPIPPCKRLVMDSTDLHSATSFDSHNLCNLFRMRTAHHHLHICRCQVSRTCRYQSTCPPLEMT